MLRIGLIWTLLLLCFTPVSVLWISICIIRLRLPLSPVGPPSKTLHKKGVGADGNPKSRERGEENRESSIYIKLVVIKRERVESEICLTVEEARHTVIYMNWSFLTVEYFTNFA